MRKILSSLLRLAITLALLYIILRFVNLQHLISTLKNAKLSWWLGAFGCYLAAQSISVCRWKLLLHAKKIDMPYRYLLALYFIGMFLNNIMPTIIGGDIARVAYLAKRTKHTAKSFA
ncbi:MAG: lysylphosphatidylglycerol synthase transmembrane domain-containing protein, partial [Candidatus Omnitrophota bacterium]